MMNNNNVDLITASAATLHSALLVGPPNSGKKSALHTHLLAYYGSVTELRRRTLVVNCIVDPPGANFVREVLQPFASASASGALRAVVLLYADELPLDAQTAIRRSMELHSATTRFFLVAYDEGRLIAPIRSRLLTRYYIAADADAVAASPTTQLRHGESNDDALDTAFEAAASTDDPLDALEREACVRQAVWTGLARLFLPVVVASSSSSSKMEK